MTVLQTQENSFFAINEKVIPEIKSIVGSLSLRENTVLVQTRSLVVMISAIGSMVLKQA